MEIIAERGNLDACIHLGRWGDLCNVDLIHGFHYPNSTLRTEGSTEKSLRYISTVQSPATSYISHFTSRRLFLYIASCSWCDFAMPSRRSHRKSRDGCSPCKQRRVKVRKSSTFHCTMHIVFCSITDNMQCDERRPECTNCTNRNTVCQYASEASVTSARSNTEESSPCSLPIHPFHASAQTHLISIPQGQTSIPNKQAESAANIPLIPRLNIRDMELLLHWCSSTYATMAHTTEVENVFQFLLPTEGLTYPFVLHGVLALSALHIARTENRSDRPEYFSIALEHQNCALALFRPEVLSLNCENSNTLFLFSGILYQLAFAKGPCSPFAEIYDPIHDLLQGFDLCRGLREMTGLTWHWVKEGRISDVLFRVDDNKIWPLSDQVQEAFSRLSRLNEHYGKDVGTHDTACYASAISSLTDLMEISQGKPRRAELALRWSFNLTDKYVDLLRERDSMALVILAHYCLLLHNGRRQWWMEDWSLHLARSVWGLLDEDWRPSAMWALKEVGLEV